MDPQAWVWRSIGLAVVVVAAVVALWFMGQVGDAVGGITLATPVASVTASPTPTAPFASPSASPSGSGLRPTPSPSPQKKPSPTPKR
ncbi:MAG TPA: hypothetical protein VID25_05830 [Candidatus Limnocylindrales bacterium]|jgi:hypothetical protein